MTVYLWGLGKNGQLGTGRSETEHTPQELKKSQDRTNLKEVQDVSCGALFSAIVFSDGCLFTTGCNKYGRLGIGHQEDASNFSKVDIPAKVSQVSCGSWHACAVTKDGALYIWGHQKACGTLLDTSTTEQKNNQKVLGVPLALPFSGGLKILGVACGHNYTFCWTEVGELYSWGRGQHGILGHGTETDQPGPRGVEELKGRVVISAGAGHSHCGVVTSDGGLFMIGKGQDGALGLGPSRLKDALKPVSVDTGHLISGVSCSKGEHHGHTLALTRGGRVLAWGDGYKGKLGLGDQEPRHIPTLLPAELFESEAVKAVSAGGIHSAAVTCAGNVYTWGCGSDGRLGHPEGKGHRYLFRSDLPRRVEWFDGKNREGSQSGAGEFSVRTCRVSAAYYHTACAIST